MFKAFKWIALRYWQGHRFLALLNIFSIALGIAVFVSVQLLNHSSLASFEASLRMVTGKANRQIVSNGGAFPETIYRELMLDPGVLAATPVVQCILPVQGRPTLYLDLIGMDPFSGDPFQLYQPEVSTGSGSSETDFFFNKNAVSITQEMADLLEIGVGDWLQVEVGGATREIQVTGLLKFKEPAPGVNKHLAVMDIANAQEFIGKTGLLDRIDMIVENDWTPAFDLPPTAEISTPKQQSGRVHEMLSAFHLNLTALSMIALFVGMFLIYNTISTEVVRRRREIGILRCLGMTPNQITFLFIGQAMVLGFIGILVGVLVGYFFAKSNLAAVSKTISSLYILGSIEKVFIHPSVLVLTTVLGMASVILAAWKPACEAGRLPPVLALQPGWSPVQRMSFLKKSVQFSSCLLSISFFLLWLLFMGGPGQLGFVVAFGLLSGIAFWVVPVTWALCRFGLRWFHPGKGVVHVALSQSLASINRTGITMASLSCAFAMMMGVSIMIHSFRETINDWINQSIRADIYISPASQIHLGPQAFLPPGLESEVASWDAVKGVDTYREVRLNASNLPVRIGATRLDLAQQFSAPRFLEPADPAIWSRLIPDAESTRRPAIMISEPMSNRLELGVGDLVELPTPSGRVAFEIAGVYRDFSSESGVALMDRRWFWKFWGDRRLHGIGIYLKSSDSLEEVLERIQLRFSQNGELRLYSNRTLRGQIMEIFDQTFSITYLLRLVAVIVSVLGIFLSMTVLVTERQRTIGLLRSIGATPGQIKRIFLIESGLLGLVGYLVGALSGLAMAWLLVFVINKAFFGWSLDWHWPRFIFIEAPILALTASMAAGWLPAWKASRLSVVDCVRDE